MPAVVFAIGDVVSQSLQPRDEFPAGLSIGIVVSLTPCEMKIFGVPRASTGFKTPGDIEMMWPNTSPAPMPNDSEYEAPSE